MKKKLPIGVSDFREVIEGDYYYVDKSLLIKELIDSGSKSVLLPRPRRFGKTLNLSMLRYFFERTDQDNSVLFQHLAIWNQGELYRNKQGRHPVIYLTFKDVKYRSWNSCYEQLTRTIRDELLRHEALLHSGILKETESDEYRRLLDLSASEAAYENSLKLLSSWLERWYGNKTVILIDEYDTPIQEGYVNGYYDEVIGFMRNLLSGALKDNASLEKGVLTGILRVAKESVFSGLNNLEVCSLLVPEYSAHFGLMEQEVETMLEYYEVDLETEQVKDWYNGYKFGGTTIYNPWSIVNLSAKWRNGPQPYWVNTSGNELVEQLLTKSGAETKKELERLLRGETIRKEIDDNIVFRDLDRNSEALWSFLLFVGYLKIESQERELRLYGELKIPNREVTFLYEEIVRGWFQKRIHSEKNRAMLETLMNGDIATFEEIFRDLVSQTFSMFDTGGDEPEKVYHAFVLGLLVNLRDRYEVKSNRESGYGRYDVMLIPKGTAVRSEASKGVILEFKKVKRNETLEHAAAAALQQIEDKRYETELLEREVKDIIKVGIAFRGKELCIMSSLKPS